MLFDKEKYRVNIPAIKALLKDKTEKERYEEISILALITGIPVIIICEYLLELYGDNLPIAGLIERLKIFYDVK